MGTVPQHDSGNTKQCFGREKREAFYLPALINFSKPTLGRRLALAAVPSRAVAANFERQGMLPKKEGDRGKKRPS